MKKIILTILVLFSIFACQATTPEEAKEAYSLVESGKAVFIDVREEDEIKGGMIEKATWIPFSKIQADEKWKEELLKTSKDKKIFLYCRSGNRSGKAQSILKENGIPSENIGGYESLKNTLPTNEAK
jgi:rhodanese-related sulfurtransferase